MTKGLYHQEMEEINTLLRALNAHSAYDNITIAEDQGGVFISVERGEHGKATPAGWLMFDGCQWTFVPKDPK